MSIVELNKLFKDVTVFTPQSGVHDANKALFRTWTRSIVLHAPVLEVVGRHAAANFEEIYDAEYRKKVNSALISRQWQSGAEKIVTRPRAAWNS